MRSTGVHLKFLALKISLTLICSGTEIASFYSHCTYLFTNSCYLISTNGKAPPHSHTDKPTTLYNSSIRSDEGVNVRNGKTHTARDLHKNKKLSAVPALDVVPERHTIRCSPRFRFRDRFWIQVSDTRPQALRE